MSFGWPFSYLLRLWWPSRVRDTKKLKKGPNIPTETRHLLIDVWCFVITLFHTVFEVSRKPFFRVLVAKGTQTTTLWGYFWTHSEKKKYKITNIGSVNTKLYLFMCWGARLGHLGQLLSICFLRVLRVRQFPICMWFYGPAGTPNEYFRWRFRLYLLGRFFEKNQGGLTRTTSM